MPAIPSKWSTRSKNKLLELKSQNKSWPEISKILKRSESACQAMYLRLKYPATKRRGKKTTAPSQELMDWFAGMALVGLISNLDIPYALTAEMAYKQAEAMLTERSKRNETKG